jgi:hypothetical protein
VAVNRKPRPFNLDKRTLVQVCFLSLIDALEGHDYRVHVIGDRLSDELVVFFAGFPKITLENAELSNALSLERAVTLALESPGDEWVYFCEDDYLHVPRAFDRVEDLVTHRGEYLAYKPKPRYRRLRVDELERKPLFLHLPDYPDRYGAKYRRPAFIFRARDCHWRQVDRTTGSFLGQARDLRSYRDALFRFAASCDDGYLSRNLYGDWSFRGRGLCLSPLPALATHMHEGTMSPLRDWEAICTEFCQAGSSEEGRSGRCRTSFMGHFVTTRLVQLGSPALVPAHGLHAVLALHLLLRSRVRQRRAVRDSVAIARLEQDAVGRDPLDAVLQRQAQPDVPVLQPLGPDRNRSRARAIGSGVDSCPLKATSPSRVADRPARARRACASARDVRLEIGGVA